MRFVLRSAISVLPAPLLAGLALVTLSAAAQACAVLDPLRPQRVDATPVVVRGAVLAVETDEAGRTVMTVAVAATYRGEDAERWQVAWSQSSIIGPPATVAETEARFGTDLVVGLVPSAPDGDGVAVLAQDMCAEPFLGAHADLLPLLRSQGLAD